MKPKFPACAPKDVVKCPKKMQVRLSHEAAAIVRRHCKREKRTPPQQASLIIEQSEIVHNHKTQSDYKTAK